MKTDAEITADVAAELKWAPDVDDTDIAVKALSGEVTLTGFVKDYAQKYLAEAAAKRIAGVSAVANDIQVKPLAGAPSDPEIARTALATLKANLPLSHDIKVLVHEGRITLEGKVEWHYQRSLAQTVVQRLHGVVGVFNLITIAPKVAPRDIKQQIETAFRRLAQVDAGHITVDAQGSDVTLRGEVRSWAEHDQAQQTAWAAPGVTHVKNEIRVRA